MRPTHLLHLAWYAVPGQYGFSPDNLLADEILAQQTKFRKSEGKGCMICPCEI